MANSGGVSGKGGADGMGRAGGARAARLMHCSVARRQVQRPRMTRRQAGIAHASAGSAEGFNRGHARRRRRDCRRPDHRRLAPDGRRRASSCRCGGAGRSCGALAGCARGASICGRAAVRCAWAAPDCRDRVPAAACGAAGPVREPAAAPGPAGEEVAPRGPAARRARSGAAGAAGVLVRTRRGAESAASRNRCGDRPRAGAGTRCAIGREPAPGGRAP